MCPLVKLIFFPWLFFIINIIIMNYIYPHLDDLNHIEKYLLNKIKNYVDDSGYYLIGGYPIYRAELAFLFVVKPLKLITKEGIKTFEWDKYLDVYINNFNKGVAFFNAEYDFKINEIKSETLDYIYKRILDNYFCHKLKDTTPTQRGWQFVEKSYPLIINEKIISQYGFYSGCVSKVAELLHSEERFKKVFILNQEK